MHTFKRDYVSVYELRDAESVLARLGDWIEDYDRQAPHWRSARPPMPRHSSTCGGCSSRFDIEIKRRDDPMPPAKYFVGTHGKGELVSVELKLSKSAAPPGRLTTDRPAI